MTPRTYHTLPWSRVLILVLVLAGCGGSGPRSTDEPSQDDGPTAMKGALDVSLEEPEKKTRVPQDPPGKDKTPPKASARVAVVAPLHIQTSDAKDDQLGVSLGEILAVALADRRT